jgi:hypothetical protein
VEILDDVVDCIISRRDLLLNSEDFSAVNLFFFSPFDCIPDQQPAAFIVSLLQLLSLRQTPLNYKSRPMQALGNIHKYLNVSN